MKQRHLLLLILTAAMTVASPFVAEAQKKKTTYLNAHKVPVKDKTRAALKRTELDYGDSIVVLTERLTDETLLSRANYRRLPDGQRKPCGFQYEYHANGQVKHQQYINLEEDRQETTTYDEAGKVVQHGYIDNKTGTAQATTYNKDGSLTEKKISITNGKKYSLKSITSADGRILSYEEQIDGQDQNVVIGDGQRTFFRYPLQLGDTIWTKGIDKQFVTPSSADNYGIVSQVSTDSVTIAFYDVASRQHLKENTYNIFTRQHQQLRTSTQYYPSGQVKLQQRLTYDANGKLENNALFEYNEDGSSVVRQEPAFPGGEEAMMAFVKMNLKYPKFAAENGIQGRVTLSFTVEKDGSIANIEVMRSPADELSKEAIRVVSSMPKWSPGLKDGKPDRTKMVIPVTFRLQ